MNKLFLAILLGAAPLSIFAQSPAPLPSGGSASIAPPSDPATEDQIREYLSLIHVDKLAHEMLAKQVDAMQTTSASYYPTAMWDDFRDEFAKIDVGAPYVKIYQKYLSREDMAAILAFYRSPSGKKLLDAQTPAIADAQKVLGAEGREIGERVVAKYKEQIEAAVKAQSAAQASPSNPPK